MRVSPVTSDSLKELSIIDMDQVGTDKPPQYVSLLVTPCLNFSVFIVTQWSDPR